MSTRVLIAASAALLGTGCLGMEGFSSGHIGCPESEIEVFNEQIGFMSTNWSARCRGVVYHCVKVQGGKYGAPHVSCRRDTASENRAPAPVYSAPVAAGCQHDNQCKGERICRAGQCVDPEPRGGARGSTAPEARAAPVPAAVRPTAPPPKPAGPSFAQRIGVTLGDAARYADAMDLKTRQGAVLLSVQPGGAAHRRNLRPRDIIVGLALSQVRSVADVRRLARPLQPGHPFHIIVKRGSRLFSFKMRF